MAEMLFEDVNGFPIPRLAGGEVRADAVKILTVGQAAKRFGRSEAVLQDLYRSTWSGLLPEDAPLLAEPSSAVVRGLDDALLQLRLKALQQMRYPHLADEHFQFFIEICRQRKLNPWANQIYADLQHSERRKAPEVMILIGIDGLRLIADRTGLYAGSDDHQFEYGGDEVPLLARATIYKIVEGQKCAFSASARWSEYYPGAGADPIWDKMRHVCLGKCAEAAALRKGFPAEMGGFYTPDEMAQSRRSAGRTAQADPKVHDDEEDDLPATRQQLELALIDLGISEGGSRAEIIRKFRGVYPSLEGRPFYATVLKAVRANPGAYGATAAIVAG